MNYCSSCGEKLEENASFCIHCGKRVHEEVKKASGVNTNAIKIVCVVFGLLSVFFIMAILLIFLFVAFIRTSLFDEYETSFDGVQAIQESDLKLLEHQEDYYAYELELYPYNGGGNVFCFFRKWNGVCH